jgi:hypothetical protein
MREVKSGLSHQTDEKNAPERARNIAKWNLPRSNGGHIKVFQFGGSLLRGPCGIGSCRGLKGTIALLQILEVYPRWCDRRDTPFQRCRRIMLMCGAADSIPFRKLSNMSLLVPVYIDLQRLFRFFSHCKSTCQFVVQQHVQPYTNAWRMPILSCAPSCSHRVPLPPAYRQIRWSVPHH